MCRSHGECVSHGASDARVLRESVPTHLDPSLPRPSPTVITEPQHPQGREGKVETSSLFELLPLPCSVVAGAADERSDSQIETGRIEGCSWKLWFLLIVVLMTSVTPYEHQNIQPSSALTPVSFPKQILFLSSLYVHNYIYV